MRPILSTYRLQFHSGFRLADAIGLIPYLRGLGVSHIHSSPLLAARSGSTHGYDVTDPSRLNPALGTEADLERLADGLHACDMGIVLDIVPNHMAAAAENPAWEDVLTYGSVSHYAGWFDIEWRARASAAGDRRILLPVLGDLLASALARGEIRLVVAAGRVRVAYFEHSWPIDPRTELDLLELAAGAWERSGNAVAPRFRELAGALRGADAERAAGLAEELALVVTGDAGAAVALGRAADEFSRGPRGTRRLRRLLDAQAYRLVYWRRAARELSYRRFFDVNELISLHAEDPEVFERTHARILAWREAGWIDGFRVDHPDGLLDPLAYLRRLADESFDWRADARYPVYVEKILAPGERLRPSWPVAGTTGYDFLNEAERLFVDPEGFAALERDYRRLTRRDEDFAVAAYAGKRRVLEGGLSPGVRSLAAFLVRLAPADVPAVTSGAAARAITALIGALPVYRTYVDRHSAGPAGDDRRLLEAALRAAASQARVPPAALELLAGVLLDAPGSDPDRDQRRLRFVQRLQQLSGPAAAKGIEDTALYRHVALVSLNEVGGTPEGDLGGAAAALHAGNAHRASTWPATMLAVTTHDTKRSADVRARLDVLSELRDDWEARIYRWRKWNRPLKRRTADGSVPDANSLYLLYQTMVGIWPVGSSVDEACRSTLAARIGEYMVKAAREAKVRTSWLDPDAEFESALTGYVDAALDPAQSAPFLEDLAAFAERIAPAGWCNGLARTLLQLTAPGVPDVYQGDELWNLAVVDPDNRRPVDFARRIAMLGSLGDQPGPERLRALLRSPGDGALKLHVLRCALRARRRDPDLFVGGGYTPLACRGGAAEHVFAFARHAGDRTAIVLVPRLMGRRDPAAGAFPLGVEGWGDTSVELPASAGATFRSELDGTVVEGDAGSLAVASACTHLPLALLISTASGPDRANGAAPG